MNLAIIQARLGSSRLPGKVLLKLGDKTVLEHVVNRVSKAKLVDAVMVATTIDERDLEIVAFCASKKIRVFIGSEQDVLDRYYQAAKLLQPGNVIRITSDCPLIDPEIIDMIIGKHIASAADYTSNTLEETYPDGLDAEVFTYQVLEKAWTNASLQSEREHVTPYLKKNGSLFKLVSVRNDKDLSSMRWTIDQEEDFVFLKQVFDTVYARNANFRTAEVLEEIARNPALGRINEGIVRNEGYLKSIGQDRSTK